MEKNRNRHGIEILKMKISRRNSKNRGASARKKEKSRNKDKSI